ncbi:MAG: hypothetical protein Q7U74_08310, partial [Saprospiraceae bacterium]|nr:hypothetical protein [Saprospiraceae bacterium]
QMLPVKALSQSVSITYDRHRDEATNRRYEVYRFDARQKDNSGLLDQFGEFVKVELEVPADGKYKLYMSYFKTPESGSFDVRQRQIPVKQGINSFAPTITFTEKEYIGDIYIEKGNNTITFLLKPKSNSQEINTLWLERIYLEKLTFD